LRAKPIDNSESSCSFLPGAAIDDFKDDLKGYDTSKGTIRRSLSVAGRYFLLIDSTTVVEWTRPAVPVMFSVQSPHRVERFVVILSVDVLAVGSTLKEWVAPDGRPLTPSDTRPVNPAEGTTVMLNVVVAPRTTACRAGEALRAKSPVDGDGEGEGDGDGDGDGEGEAEGDADGEGDGDGCVGLTHALVPESVNDAPASGTNLQS
jgi:hypothetical protein